MKMEANQDRDILRSIAGMQRYHATTDQQVSSLRTAQRKTDKNVSAILELLQQHSSILIKLEGSGTLAEAVAGPAMTPDERRVADTMPQQVNS